MESLSLIERISELPSRLLGNRGSYEDVLVVGRPSQISLQDLAPAEAVRVSLRTQGEIEVYSESNQLIHPENLVSLSQIPRINLLARTFSDRPNDRCLEIVFQDDAGHLLSPVKLELTCLRICLDVDADRDGIVDDNNPHKGDWQWGINGQGAILMVKTDRDQAHSDSQHSESIKGLLDLKDSSFMIIRRVGLSHLPSGYEVYLSVSPDRAKRICIYDELHRSGYELIGPKRSKAKIRSTDRDILLSIKGLSYPDIDRVTQ